MGIRGIGAVSLLLVVTAGCEPDIPDESSAQGGEGVETQSDENTVPGEAPTDQKPLLCAEDAQRVLRLSFSWDLVGETPSLIVQSHLSIDTIANIVLLTSDGLGGGQLELGSHLIAADEVLRLPLADSVLPRSKVVSTLRVRADVFEAGASERRLARELSDRMVLRQGVLSPPTGDPDETFYDHAGLSAGERTRIRAERVRPGVDIEAIVIEPGTTAADLASSLTPLTTR
jgi:hypothetical protein